MSRALEQIHQTFLQEQSSGNACNALVLNPSLYGRLKARFGKVKVTNPGIANTERVEQDIVRGRAHTVVVNYGETYLVNCPFCHDTRQRMSVNHTYGTTGSKRYDGELRTFMWRCYNEDCQRREECRQQLAEWLIWSNGNRGVTLHVEQGIEAPAQALEPCQLPGRCLPASVLSSTHPMISYFAQRRQGMVTKSTLIAHDVSYCADSPLREAVGRAIIPLYFKEKLVGWQARYLGDVDWKATGIQKYYNLPGFRKTLMLYEYDRAAAIPSRPYVVVVEGVTSAWAVGPMAVALFGKSMSQTQRQLLCETWDGKPIFIYLDGSAVEEARKISASLAGRRGPVVVVRMDPSLDPGNLDYTTNLGNLRRAAREQGITI